METRIFLINGDQVQSLRSRVNDQENLPSCIEEVRRMIDIKSALCLQANERSGCCGPGMPMSLFGEVQILERILQKLEDGHTEEAIALLEDYQTMIV